MMLDKKTDELDNILNFVETEDELEHYLNETLSKPLISLPDYIKKLCEEKKIKKKVPLLNKQISTVPMHIKF